MTTLIKSPIVCPLLIGREQQIEALLSLGDQARIGHGKTILLVGEAGIGKSRLVAEACQHAAQHGMPVLRGRCFEPDAILPYAPLLDLLRVYLSTQAQSEIPIAIGPLLPYLHALLPELTARFAHLPPPAPFVAEERQRHLVHAFVQYFLQQVDQQDRQYPWPVLVVIEDLHWCDEASLDVLLALARRITRQPILLICTYRDDEVQPSLAQLLATLERERLSLELHLQQLSYDETDAMLRAIFNQQRPIRTDFLQEIYALTEGNPFFIEEVITSLVSTGAIYYTRGQWDRKPLEELRIPRTIQTALRERVVQLSPEAQQFLALATVAGRRFDFTVLQRLTSNSEATLLQWVKELIAAQLVVEESTDVFVFRHALTHAALYNDLLARERRALHHAVAEALEPMLQAQEHSGAETWLADLATHCFAAQDWPKAFTYARRAAEKAQPHVPRATIIHLSHAIQAAQHMQIRPSAELYRARGQIYETLGAFNNAQADYEAAIAEAKATNDQRIEWQVLLDLGFLWAERDYVRMGQYRQSALALARQLNDQRSLGQSLNRVGNWYLFVEQPHEALRYHQEALALFQSVGDQANVAATYDLLGVTQFIGGDIAAGLPLYEQALALFRALGDDRGLASSLMYFAARGANLLWTATSWPVIAASQCQRDGERALWMTQQLGWRSGEAGAQVILAYGYCPRGEYGVAFKYARTALTIAQSIDHTVWSISALCALGAIMYDLLAFDLARRYLEQAFDLAHGLGIFFLRNVAGLLVPTCIAQRDFARARAVLDLTLPPDMPMQTQGQRMCWAASAELALASNHPDDALDIVIRLRTTATPDGANDSGSIPRLWHLQGIALAALGHLDEAEEMLRAANNGAVQRALRPLCWRIQMSIGKLAQSRARRKQAEGAFATARMLIHELGSSIPDQDLREGFVPRALALLPRISKPTAHQKAKATFDGLTAREREIAALIAQGRINREISTMLVVGERTVETHISNILSKLDFSSRRQIAAWAVEKGLAKYIE